MLASGVKRADRPDLPLMLNPSSGQSPEPGQLWMAENGRVKLLNGQPVTHPRWSERTWMAFIERMLPHRERCLFAVAPDVVGDAEATWELSQPWLDWLRSMGYRAAFVAQDGIERWRHIPWASFDVLFIGGSTEFKLADSTYRLVL